MKTMITKKDIQDLASLSRIKIDDSEAESLTSEIGSILGYVKQIENIPISDSDEAPTPRNVMRDDDVTHDPRE